MANYAIDKNPPDAVIHITTNGSNWVCLLQSRQKRLRLLSI